MRGYWASVLFAGDSILDGMSRFLPGACRDLGVRRFSLWSRTGSSAKDWVEGRWLEGATASFRPNIVVVALGTNPQERDPQEYAGMVSLVYDAAQAGGAAEVYFVGPFAVDDDGRRNAAVRSVFGSHAINGYDLARGLPRAGAENVHFTVEGYRQLAERLVRRLGPAVVRAQRPGRSLGAAALIVGGVSAAALSGEWWIPVVLPFVPP